MTSSQAVKILEEMLAKLPGINKSSGPSWRSQLMGYLIIFFGKDSPQYEYIENHDIWSFGIGGDEYRISQAQAAYNSFVGDCIESIKNTGIKKREWKHVIITTHPALFWSILTAVILFTFWLGGQLAANKGNQTTYQIPVNKSDSIHK